MITHYNDYRNKMRQSRIRKRTKKATIKFIVLIGLLTSYFGKRLGGFIITIGCVMELFFLPLCKVGWIYLMELKNSYWD